MSAFRARSADDTPAWISHHLRSNHAPALEGLSDTQVEQRIRAGLQRTERHGLRNKNDVLAYIVLMFEIAPDFDQRSRIRAILDWTTPLLEGRITCLMQHTTGQDWMAAREESNPKAWEFLVSRLG